MPAPGKSPPMPPGSPAGAVDKLPMPGIEKGGGPPIFGIAVPPSGKVGSGIPAALASSNFGRVRFPMPPVPGSPGRLRPPGPGAFTLCGKLATPGPLLPNNEPRLPSPGGSPGANPPNPVLPPGTGFMPRLGAVPGGRSPGMSGDGRPGNFGQAGSAGSLGAEFTSFCRASAGEAAASVGCGCVRGWFGIAVWSERNRTPARFLSDSASVTPPRRL
mmetsp:Transcript_102558/g.203579  ORF Transcript_102558/g.203579 Transcript_102558/m.203579 type:complete len:216 (-) Transcript_102558:786-1433(-)